MNQGLLWSKADVCMNRVKQVLNLWTNKTNPGLIEVNMGLNKGYV